MKKANLSMSEFFQNESSYDPLNRPSQTSSTLVTVCLSAWVIVITFIGQGGGWLAEQIFLAMGLDWPWWSWVGIVAVQTIILWLFLLPFSWRWRDEQFRRYFQFWAIASLFPILLLPIRFVLPPTAQTMVLPQIGLTLLFGIIILYFFQRQYPNLRSWDQRLMPLAGLLALILSFPWFAWGALGSLLDIVLNLVSGLAFGLMAAVFLAYGGARTQSPNIATKATPLWLDGIIQGTTLLLLASGLGVNGMQLFLMLILPSVGWLVAGLAQMTDQQDWRPSLALVCFIGLLAAAPQIWLDADELVLILSITGGEILSWAFFAASISILLAWTVGIVFGVTVGWGGWHSAALGRWGLLSSVAFGIGIYTGFGQIGFHGDHLFVIYKDQSDLSAAYNIENIDQRRSFVYQALLEQAERSQSDLRSQLDRLNIAYQPYYLVNAIDVTGGPFIRFWLERQPNVDRVLLNPTLRPLPAPIPMASGEAIAPTEPQWNLTLIGVDRVWEELRIRGEGVVIGQSDSGVEWRHPELQATYRGGQDNHDYHWLDPWNQSQEPVDIGGHGTHTLGSVVGQTTGVAPGATWYGCANLPRNLANPALYLDCMQFMLAPYPLDGNPFQDGDPSQSADVLNNSWGCPDIEGCDEDALIAGVRALRAAGIFVVTSAGNDGPSCESVREPISLYDDVFSVGAVDEGRYIAEFSSRGPVTADGSERVKPDIVAPGVEVLSAFPNGTYDYADGTSMAGPHVAGVVALIWSANPDLIGQIDQTEQILRETAQPYNVDTVSNSSDLEICNGNIANMVGSGLVDAYAAVQRALDIKAE